MRVYVLTEEEFVLLDDTELDGIQDNPRFELEDELDLLYETSPLFNVNMILSEIDDLYIDANPLGDAYERICDLLHKFVKTNINKIKIYGHEV